jgi:two-component system, OmpR family, KDP operon response regulator KdpE
VSGDRVLVVDDDRALLRVLTIGLTARGYDVVTARTGADGVVQASLTQPALLIVDVSLPDLDGVEVCSRIREFSEAPILVLSALGTEDRKVEALDRGADDYVTKPFGMAELEARIRVLLRRTRSADVAADTSVTAGPLTCDLLHHMATLDGAPLRLTGKEFDLLAFLARHAGKVCTHQMILREVWGATYSSEANYLRVYAHRLRRKLGVHGAMLVTHAGIGYELSVDAVASGIPAGDPSPAS